jgi:hypothetical protein
LVIGSGTAETTALAMARFDVKLKLDLVMPGLDVVR